MDITLERILSLLPKKPDGKFVKGAKKEFCENIGAPVNIVSEWENGKTKSYRNYLYAIAAKYDVSVEWLKGETDIKKAAPSGNGKIDELLQLAGELTPEQFERLLAYGQGMKDAEK